MSRNELMINETKELIIAGKGDAFLVSDALLDYILNTNNNDRYLALRVACEQFAEANFESDADEDNEKNIDFTSFSKKYSKLINSLISVLVSDSLQNSISPEEFYKALWESVINNSIFEIIANK